MKNEDDFKTYYVSKDTYDKVKVGDSICFDSKTMSKERPKYVKDDD